MASSATRQHVDQRSSGFRKCSSEKCGYATKAAALDAAELLMLAGRVKPGCHLTPYLCDRCGEYHIGNRVIVHVPRSQRPC